MTNDNKYFLALSKNIFGICLVTFIFLLFGCNNNTGSDMLVYPTWSNSGWSITFQGDTSSIKEIKYRINGQGDFISTGSLAGGAVANTFVGIEPVESPKLKIEMKYISNNGAESSVSTREFDLDQLKINEAKDILTQTNNSWLEDRPFNGKMLIYFTHLVTNRVAIKEIKYSLDSDALDQSFPLESEGPPYKASGKSSPGMKIYIEVPTTYSFIALKLYYLDGSSSNVWKLQNKHK